MDESREEVPDIGWLADQLRPVVTRLTLLLRREAPTVALSIPQASLLATLAQHGPARVTALADAAHVRQPSMTALINRLERAGWVARTPDPTDSRAILATLTPEGRRVVDSAARSRAAVLANRLSRLSPEHRRAVAAALPALQLLAGETPPT